MATESRRRLRKYYRTHKTLCRLSTELAGAIRLVNDLIDTEQRNLGIEDEDDVRDFQIGDIVQPFSGPYSHVEGEVVHVTRYFVEFQPNDTSLPTIRKGKHLLRLRRKNNQEQE